MCPYMAGGRSRRGSPKAGTTVLVLRFNVLNLVGFITEVTLDNHLIISSFVRL